jgi:CrcB protein
MTKPEDSHPELPLDPDAGSLLPAGTQGAGHNDWSSLCLVAVGGIVGTAVRYGVSLALPTTTGHWPTGTFTVNLVGAFILGVLLETLVRHGPDSGGRRQLRLLVGVGFCGSLTTFSTLAVESDLLLRSHDPGLALSYAVASVVGGLVLTWAGVFVGAAHHRRRDRVAS